MKKIWPLVFVLVIFSCSDSQVDPKQEDCEIEATVVDLTGLDGCGFVFELTNGERVIPLRLFRCGTPPLPKEELEDPLLDFEFINGEKVKIAYEQVEGYAETCMVGKTVKITCITELETQTAEE